MNETNKCPQCGKPVPDSAPGGLCPECMLKVGAAAPTEEFGPGGTRVIRPSPTEPASVDEIAKYFPQLEILECLGRGGMGVVYKARHPKLDRFVALKILAPEKEGDPKFADRFEREARALARLSHPNIVGVHDFGETDGLFYLIMEFVDGTNLRRLIQARRIDPEQALAIVPRICEALQYAHGKGVVHRDIKPENVLLAKDGEVKIADFGIAKILQHEEGQPSLTEDGTVGTPHYMAPEQVETPKKVDHRADIYSLGVVFYEMLTGELPLGKFAPPSRKVEMDVRLDEVVLHALEKEPDRRYQQADQIKADVETISTSAAKADGGRQKSEVTHPPLNPIDVARRQVSAPGIGLIVCGILNWVCMPLSLLVATKFSHDGGSGGAIPMGSLAVLLGLLPLVLGGFMIYAGLMMRRLKHYPAAIIASVGAILFTPGNLVGLPIGIWALVVLCGKDVRAAFRAVREGVSLPSSPGQSEKAGGGRFGTGWLVAGIVVLVPVVGLIALLLLGVLAGLFSYRLAEVPQARPRQATAVRVVPAESAHPLPEDAQALSFGAIQERVLHQRVEGTTNWFLDFETGTILMPPPELAESLVRQELTSVPGTRAMQFADWVKRTGVDVAVYGPEAFETLGGIWVWTHGETYEDWDDLDALTPAQMLTLIQAREGDRKSHGRPQVAGVGLRDVLYRDLSVNYFFKTRDGALGVFQVVGRDEASGGLKLRYKLAGASVYVQQDTFAVSACINNLRQIDGAKEIWRLENGKPAAATPTVEDLDPYIRGGVPQCPSGSPYVIGPGTEEPTCSVPGHSLTPSTTVVPHAQVLESGESFGPVIEYTLTPPEISGSNQPAWWMDLDAGQVVQVPADLLEVNPELLVAEVWTGKDPKSIVARHEAGVIGWMKSNGVDLACGIRHKQWGLLTLRESPLQLFPVDNRLWNETDPKQLLHELDGGTSTAWNETEGSAFSVHALEAEPSFPLTYVFRTQGGTAGLLQLTGFATGGEGIQIRLRQIHSSGQLSSAGSPALPRNAIVVGTIEREKLQVQLKAAAREFMEAVVQGDLAAAMALMAPDSPMARMGADQHEVNFRETQTAYESSPDRLVQFTDDLVDGDWAAVRIASPTDTPEHGLFVVLHRTDSKWRIFQVNDAWVDTALETYLDQVRPATAVKSSEAYPSPVTARVHMESDVVGTVEREKLQVQLKAAQQRLENLEMRYEAGVMPEDDVIAVRAEVGALEARLAGDPALVADLQLKAAQQLLELAQARFEAGLIPRSELISAQAAVQLQELEVQVLDASRSDTLGGPPTTRVHLMEADPNRRAWRWRVFREPGSRMVYGILDVTDPNNPKQVLMGMENNPLTLSSSQDYTLNLDPEVDDWRIEIETAWAGENGGRGATRERVKAPVEAILSGVHAEPFGELNTDRYHVFWEGELSVRGEVLKRLKFVARLAVADDPVQNILHESDPVQVMEEAYVPIEFEALETRLHPGARTRLMIALPLLLLGLGILAAIVGAAVWWVYSGTKTGGALGRAALVLAIGGLPFTVILSVILGSLGVVTAVLFCPLLLAFEIPAFCLGLLSRQTGLGKAAMIVSATLVIISLLFVL